MIRVYVDMVGDLFHVGHINLFKKAKALFPDKEAFLVVGVHSDEDVSSYKRTPIIKQKHRYEMIRFCKLVDQVIESAPLEVTKEFLEEHQIDYVVHGDDINQELMNQHKVPIDLGIVRYFPYTAGISTTKIIEKIRGTNENN